MNVIRSMASALAMVACAYLCLGTSCLSTQIEEQASVVVRFEPGETIAVLDVHAEGHRLQLHFDRELIITRDGEPTDAAPDAGTDSGATSEPSVGDHGTVCMVNPDASWSLSDPKPGTTCLSGDVGSARYELFRQDAAAALDVTVTATIIAHTDCDGNDPPALGVVLHPDPQQ